ncbi:hypothetical protein C900_04286 [Fulvivirga imtechensis AK7]|uniref:DUF1905 domain-containing protein n=1 Tax=Fulvivirga imtechensis AK7 TaxID=1237149 RepID=L8K0H3_9BACT|nr:YdeI/OmpD-associated family protein [Fulvivirga imtechensis]ELR73434.1 hypothetical protein C900_04286 [Fulvivirga imtechensis AK7]
MNPTGEILVDSNVQLERFPGKGGWTYARLPDVQPVKTNPFGWRKVSGFIDDFEIRQYHLMPMGNGQLFLPVKAPIRKKIKKEAGDWVKIVLYEDNGPTEVPEEFITCLRDDPDAWEYFKKLSDPERKKYVDWIYGVKTEDLKIERMAEAINRIAKGEKF